MRANPSIIIAALASSSMEAKRRGLDRRNVAWDPCESPDPFEVVREVHPQTSVTDATSSRSWNDDLDKCTKDPQEFILQRTIKMRTACHAIPCLSGYIGTRSKSERLIGLAAADVDLTGTCGLPSNATRPAIKLDQLPDKVLGVGDGFEAFPIPATGCLLRNKTRI
ncbi:hypothetical protein F5883DRAFT_239356 [Diaporthe sp. PMI_573]|nr:hypothetical protein F5883DRAFT_239356 [Diaporthaceae sp. PMI_573]